MRLTAAHYGSSSLTHIGDNGLRLQHGIGGGIRDPYSMNFDQPLYYGTDRVIMNMARGDVWRDTSNASLQSPNIDSDGQLSGTVPACYKLLCLPLLDGARVRLEYTGSPSSLTITGDGVSAISYGAGFAEWTQAVPEFRRPANWPKINIGAGPGIVITSCQEVGTSNRFDATAITAFRSYRRLRAMDAMGTNSNVYQTQTWANRSTLTKLTNNGMKAASLTLGSGNGRLTFVPGYANETVIQSIHPGHIFGAGGNSITIQINAASGAGSVVRTGYALVITPAAGADTAAQIVAQVTAAFPDGLFIIASLPVGSDGSLAPGVTAATNLTGGISNTKPDGLALEDLCDIANASGCDLHICIPQKADDDYVTQAAILCRDRLNSSRKLIVELGNEIWNTAFPSYAVAAGAGRALGYPDNYAARWYGARHAEVMALVSAEFTGANAGRLVRVLAWQNGNPAVAAALMGYAGAGSFDEFQTAPYFGDVAHTLPTVTTDADVIHDRFPALIDTALANAVTIKNSAAALGKTYGWYEGGQHNQVGDLTLAQTVQRSPRMKEAYGYYLSEARRLLGPDADLTMYLDVGPITTNGSASNAWGHREYQGQLRADAPKYDALLEAISGNFPAYYKAGAVPVLSGLTYVGQTLTVTTPTAYNAVTTTREWLRGASVISGETGTTYVQQSADIGEIINHRVTLTDSLGRTETYTTTNIVATTASRDYDSDADALFARIISQPDDTRKGLIDDLIVALKAAGVWTKFDAFYVLAAHDAQTAKLNWKSASFDAIAVNSPTFTVDRGYAGNGTTSYLSTGFNPTTAPSPQFVQNSAHIGVWNRSTTINNSMYDMGGNAATPGTMMDCGTTGGQLRGRINHASNVSFNNLGAIIGHNAISRVLSTGINGYLNGAFINQVALTSAAPTNETIIICGAGTGANFSTRELAAVHFGSGLSAAEIDATNDALAVYMTAVGA